MDTKITVDAHSLIWFLDVDLKYKLSDSALKAIRKAQEESVIYVPIIAIMEIVYLIERGRINTSFDDFMSIIELNRNFQIIPLNTELLKIAISLQGLEIHDRLILATAIMTDSILVSKDMTIRAKGINVIW
jgi:PIN domain nuclease of toxin-antitoxin system